MRNLRVRAGVTLIEMLVAMAISLIMMAAVANLFAVVGSSVSASRALINMSEQVRAARNRLQADLGGVTAPMLPPLRPENGDGYFEYFEGPSIDYTNFNSANYNKAGSVTDTLTGDPDDVLMFTTRSKDGLPFVGKVWNGSAFSTVESQSAEVAWFTIPNGRSIPLADVNGNVPSGGTGPATVQLYTLYRRVLLVAPEYNNSNVITFALAAGNGSSNFFNEYDLSAHYVVGTPATMLLNSMSDLTKRENRFAHDYININFPYPLYLPPSAALLGQFPANNAQSLQPLQNVAGYPPRSGEDVVLTNVLSFDVKAYDPYAPLYLAADNKTALVPSDPGYWNAASNAAAAASSGVIGYGAFVDLGYGWNWNAAPLAQFSGASAITSWFVGQPTSMPGTAASGPLHQWNARSHYTTAVAFPTYDTWSLHYEGPGSWNTWTNYNNTPTVANYGYNGINGFDDNNDGVVDDPGEYQYPPPYSSPLRGIQVKIRVYEPDSKQIREVTIVQDFLP